MFIWFKRFRAFFRAIFQALIFYVGKSWEVENTIDRLKVHLLGRKTLIRSLNPREVVQEVYGWLLGHWSVRYLMFQVAESAHISPLRLSFTETLHVVGLCLNFSGSNQKKYFFFTWLVMEILDEQISEPEGRSKALQNRRRNTEVF